MLWTGPAPWGETRYLGTYGTEGGSKAVFIFDPAISVEDE